MEKFYGATVITHLLMLLASTEKVNISNGSTLMAYLCSPNGTISPNTELAIIAPNLTIHHVSNGSFCRVENTTNVTIVASGDFSYSTVECKNYTGFKFWNVTNLAIKSVKFKNCENLIPTLKLNTSGNNMLFLQDKWTTFFFDNCNISLSNVLAYSTSEQAICSILGINLCGSIKTVTISSFFGDMTFNLYYQDCPLSGSADCYTEIFLNPVTRRSKMENTPQDGSSTDNVLVFFQQSFKVLVFINTSLRKNDMEKVMNIKVRFYGGANSKVIYQGYPYNLCTPNFSGGYMPLLLSASFYGSGAGHLVVLNTAFIGDHSSKGVVQFSFSQFCQFCPINYTLHNSSIQNLVEMHNVSICESSEYLVNSISTEALVSAEYDGENNNTINLIMENVTILDQYSPKYYSQTAGKDLVSLENVNVQIKGINVFNSSGGGAAIRASNSNITMNGTLTIVDGYTYASNGIVLESNSTLYLKEPLNVTFFNRKASKGSAIKAPDFNLIKILPQNSFVLDNITSINIALHFMNSSTNGFNTQVYAPKFNFQSDHFQPFTPKTWDFGHSQYAYTTVIDTVFKKIVDYDKYTSLSNGLCFKANGQPPWTCKYIDYAFHNRSKLLIEEYIHVYPGAIAFSVDPLDTTRKYLIAGISDPSICFDSTVNKESVAVVHKVYACVIDKFTNKTSYATHVNVSIDGAFNDLMLTKLYVNTNCPVGFEMLEEGYCRCQCVCMKTFTDSNYFCDISTLRFRSPAKYWTGLDKGPTTILSGSNCPPNYCNHSFRSFYLEDSLSQLSCRNNRSGTLCGQCRENYSAMFGSDACHPHCSNLYLLTLPVYALAGLLLVVVLFALRLTVATGTINGVIFYANILGLVMDIVSEFDGKGLFLKVMHKIIYLLNLNLGFPVCLYDGMSPTAAIGFQFIFPVYLWSLVLGMVILSRCSTKLANFISKSSVQVLATLFYFSFSSLLRTVIDVISPTTLQVSTYNQDDGTYNYSSKVVWYYGGLDYGYHIHGFLLSLAILVLVFLLLPFSAFTTFSHSLLRFRLFNRLRPFIEAYGGPFKVKKRFWFGLRLWITIVLFVVDGALQGSDTYTMMTMHLFVIGTFILLQACIQPFNNSKFTGSLDMLYMLNLLLFILFFLILKEESKFFKCYKILLSIALSTLLFSLLHHLWSVRHYISCNRFLSSYKAIDENDVENSDDSLFDAAKRREPVITKYQTY